jgi:hypothetical protein
MLNKNEAVIPPEDGLAAQNVPKGTSNPSANGAVRELPIRCGQLNYLDCCKFATVQGALCSRCCKLLRCWAGAQAKDYPQGSKLIGSDLDAEMAGEVMR